MTYRNKKFAIFAVAVILVPFILNFLYNLIFDGGIKEDGGSDYMASLFMGIFAGIIFLLPCVITWKLWNGKTRIHFYGLLLLLITLEAIVTSAIIGMIDAEAGFYLGLWYFISATSFAVPNILSICILGFVCNRLIKSSI